MSRAGVIIAITRRSATIVHARPGAPQLLPSRKSYSWRGRYNADTQVNRIWIVLKNEIESLF